SPLCQKLVETALTNEPYEVRFAASGHEALNLFEAERPDILIADWMMPPPSGLDLCREVRKHAGGYTYIILITSKSEKENLIEGLDAGADDYVTKPFDPGELLARIRVGSRVIEMSREIETRNA